MTKKAKAIRNVGTQHKPFRCPTVRRGSVLVFVWSVYQRVSFSRFTGQSPVDDSLRCTQRSGDMSHGEMRGGQLFTRGQNIALKIESAQTNTLLYNVNSRS